MPGAVAGISVAWDRPWGLWALALPVLLVLLSLRRERPRAVAIGTLALWRDAPEGMGGARRRHRLPPARIAFVLALVAGALALAGPHRPEPEVRPLWRVVIDGGASLQLPHTDEHGVASGDGSRLDVALAALEDARRAADVELELRLDRGRGLELLGDDVGELARDGPWRASLGRAPRVDPRAHDRPGVLLLTDRASAEAPRRGGLVASGGGPVPGPIARAGEVRIVWDGAELREEPASAALDVTVEGEPPEVLGDLLALWREDRGLVDGQSGDEPSALRVVFAVGGTPIETRLARDGWSAVGSASRAPLRGSADLLRPWLRADLGAGPVPVVTWGAGVVHVGLATLEEPSGEPGAFAVSWSELLDSAVRAADDVVPLERRVAAGASVFDPPEPASAVVRAGPDWPWSARLALAAAGLVTLAVLLGEGGSASAALGRR